MTNAAPQISFGHSREFWDGYPAFLQNLIIESGATEVCDIGGGANPMLDLGFLRAHRIGCTVLDIAEGELDKAPAEYAKIAADVASPAFDIRDRFDFAFSKMLAEHVRDAEQFHRNVHQMLDPGGIAFHFFPTLFAFPFFVNRILPESGSSGLLGIFSPRDKIKHAKFPAYYDWCRGPSQKMIRNYERIGFEVLQYRGFFGHEYYRRIPPLDALQKRFEDHLVQKPVPFFTTYACVVLKKV